MPDFEDEYKTRRMSTESSTKSVGYMQGIHTNFNTDQVLSLLLTPKNEDTMLPDIKQLNTLSHWEQKSKYHL